MYGSAHSHPPIMTPLTENHESKPEKVNILHWSLGTAMYDIVSVRIGFY